MAGMDDWSPVETTLDEPVSETIRRDLREVGAKLKLVLLPRASQHGVLDRLKEWDLWGPLAVCLTLSIALSAGAPENTTQQACVGQGAGRLRPGESGQRHLLASKAGILASPLAQKPKSW